MLPQTAAPRFLPCDPSSLPPPGTSRALERPFPSAPTSVLLAEGQRSLSYALTLAGCLGILPGGVGCVELRGAERQHPGLFLPHMLGSGGERGAGQLPLSSSLS